MPLFFYQGPSSAHKQERLFKQIAKDLKTQNTVIVAVSDQSLVAEYKNKIIQHSQKKVVTGQLVVSFEELLEDWLKQNITRFHKIDSFLSQYLLFLLVSSKYPHMIKTSGTELDIVGELYHFFCQLKSCGLGPEKAKEHLSYILDDNDVFELFKDYQLVLRDYCFYDQSDLYLETIRLLKQKRFKIKNEKCHLYLSQIYPLKPSHREILSLLSENFSQMALHVFYDEDYSQDYYLLDKAYEDLGRIATNVIELPSTSQNKHPVIWLKNPYHEIFFVTEMIAKQQALGASLDQMAIVLSDKQYVLPLLNRLRQLGMPYSLQMSLPISQFLTLNDISDHPVSGWVDDLKNKPNLFGDLKLRAKASLDSLIASIDYARMLLKDLDDKVPEDKKNAYFSQLIKHHAMTTNNFSGQIVVLPVEKAFAFASRNQFFIGCSLEAQSTQFEPKYFSYKLYSHADFAELLESPSFKLKIKLEKIKHWLQANNDVLITAPEFDFSDKPATPLKLSEGCELVYVQAPAPKVPVTKKFANDYYQSKKKTFSLSALDEYIQCPYRYYAMHHLKIERPSVTDLEPPGDVKGKFVHKIMQKLIQENETTYLEGLEYASYRDKLIKKLGHIIQNEIEQSEELKPYHEQMVEFYAYRVYKTIIALMNIESKNYKSFYKKSVPKYYEWAFGYAKNKEFVLKTKAGDIQIGGRVDRIDVHPSSYCFSVIDYKTGNAPTVSSIIAAKSLQLPIYLMAVNKMLLPDCLPSAGLYYLLKTNEIKGFVLADSCDVGLLTKRSQITEEAWCGLQEAVIDSVGEVVKSIHEGKFDPNPQSEQLCRFCDYKRICGK